METKICNECEVEKELSEFPTKNKNKGTYYPKCNVCHREYRRNHYRDNKNKILEQDRITSRERKDRNRQFVWDYLKKNPCVDCANDNPIVLQFDHKDDVEKVKDICAMVGGKWSIKNIIKEINKCDVRCANCHQIRTSKQQNWYMNINK